MSTAESTKSSIEPPPSAAGATERTMLAPEHRALGRWLLAVSRLSIGFVFLWAFLDKTFGWGYTTPSARSWINGGSPTKGFLSHVAAGPFVSTFHSLAGNLLVDWLFMLGLLAVGVAFMAGIALRPAALAGTLMLAMMWAAEWPPAKIGSAGPTMSTNPLVDYHVIYALVLLVIAWASSDPVFGLGNRWSQLPIVRDHAILR